MTRCRKGDMTQYEVLRFIPDTNTNDKPLLRLYLHTYMKGKKVEVLIKLKLFWAKKLGLSLMCR